MGRSRSKGLRIPSGFLLISSVFSIWVEVGSGLAGNTESIFRTHPTQRSYREEGLRTPGAGSVNTPKK